MPKITYNGLREKMKSAGFNSYTVKTSKIIGQQTYRNIMQDKSISTETLAKLCEYFNCDVAELCEFAPETKSE